MRRAPGAKWPSRIYLGAALRSIASSRRKRHAGRRARRARASAAAWSRYLPVSASPRLVSTEYPRGRRGVAATRSRNFHIAAYRLRRIFSFERRTKVKEMVREGLARAGQLALCDTRLRVRGTEDPPSPLNHVLHDGLGLEQVVTCVEMKSGHVNAVAQHGSVLVRRRPSPVSGWSMRTQARLLLMPSVRSSSDPSDR